jgi:hypothetical protein
VRLCRPGARSGLLCPVPACCCRCRLTGAGSSNQTPPLPSHAPTPASCTPGPSFGMTYSMHQCSTTPSESMSQSLKKTLITTVLTAVKKNKQPTHTPGGPGRLKSWSGPVDPEFQGRLRFSYDSMPGLVPISGWSYGGVGPERGLRGGGRRRWC